MIELALGEVCPFTGSHGLSVPICPGDLPCADSGTPTPPPYIRGTSLPAVTSLVIPSCFRPSIVAHIFVWQARHLTSVSAITLSPDRRVQRCGLPPNPTDTSRAIFVSIRFRPQIYL